jgi:GNAT superfamily N-acetyltransferase
VTAAPVLRPFDRVADAGWADSLLEANLAGRLQARRGELMDPLAGDAEGLVAELDGRPIGLITWVVGGAFSGPGEAEVRVLVVAEPSRSQGAGGTLIGEAVRTLARAGIERAWLVTTNDNVDALRFYQRRGWRLAELHPGAVDEARRLLKPEIGQVAANAIPIRDELVLEIELGAEGWPGASTSIPGHLG